MRKLDSFFDTYEKRTNFVYLVFLICFLLFAFTHIRLGFQLIHIHNYDEVLSLVDQSYVRNSYFGKNALSLLNIQVFNIYEYIVTFIQSFEIYEILFFVGNFMCLFTKKKSIAYLNLLSFIFVYFFIVIIFLFAVHSTSLYHVISYLHIIGICLLIIYTISFFIQLKESVQTIKVYQEALKVEVMIVEEGA